jgi:thioesterase domain-containing protein
MPQEAGDGRRGIAVHLKRMSERGFREKLAYIREYSGYRIIRTKLALTEIMSSLCFRMRRPIPAFMKSFYLNVYIPEVNARAERNYSPRVYPGIITFFQATAEVERDPRMFWGKLTSEGLDVRMVPAAHKDILVDPIVRELAGKLAAALAEARSGA